MDFLPVPRHAGQEVVLWPWHLGHNVLSGIARLPSLEAHSVGLAVGQAQQRHTILVCDLDHVACSPRRIGVSAVGSFTPAGACARRSACTTATRRTIRPTARCRNATA